MEVRATTLNEIAEYTALARSAQEWLRSRGLLQYVPAAHEEYAEAVRARVESGTLFTVLNGGAPVGFFSLDSQPSRWWPADGVAALYLAGMVVSRSVRGRGVGRFIIRRSVEEATRRGCEFVRLDCHAGNRWLCEYYESNGFELQGIIEQHPGYEGCLYRLRSRRTDER
jgi:GNAT superfamily N-acetyltransferase